MKGILQRGILWYLRYFPIDYGKELIDKLVDLPIKENNLLFKAPGGNQYKLDLKDHVMRQIFLRGIYERNTYRHLSKLIKPEMTFVDAGANIGAYTLNIGKLLTKGEVFSFEPNPRALVYLKENIKINKLNNINVVEMGLSDKDEIVALYTPSLTTASINKNQASSEKEVIQLTTLDAYCSKHNISNVDVLKIDTEGHEMKCLTGANDIIKQTKKMILVVEIDDNCERAGYSREELFDFIIHLGFKAYKPRGAPFGLKQIDCIPHLHNDNIIFLKGY